MKVETKALAASAAGIAVFLLLLWFAESPALWFFDRLTAVPLLLLLLAFPAGWLAVRYLPEKQIDLSRLAIAVLSTAAGILFYIFRMQLILAPPEGNGDSIFVLEQVPVYTALFGFRGVLDEILELYVHSRFYALLAPAGINIFDSYAILSIAAGIAFTALCLNHLNRRSLTDFLLGFVLLLITPAMAVFFGYVEHYDTPSLLILCVCLYSMRFIDSARKLEPIHLSILGALCGLMAMFHLITVSILPALVYFVWQAAGSVRKFVRYSLYAAIPAVTVMAAVLLYFVVLAEYPINPTKSGASHPYPLAGFFTVKHALEMFNLLSAGMPALFIAAWFLPGPKRVVSSPLLLFLFLVFAGFIGIASIVDPLIGFPSDWDLLSLFRVGGNLFLFHALITLDSDTKKHLLPGLLALCLTITALWVERNHHMSPESRRNLERVLANGRDFIDSIGRDPVYASLPRERRKSAVEAKLFFAGADRKLAELGREDLRRELSSAREEYDRTVVLPEKEYQASLPELYEKLVDLNRRISVL